MMATNLRHEKNERFELIIFGDKTFLDFWQSADFGCFVRLFTKQAVRVASLGNVASENLENGIEDCLIMSALVAF